MSNKPPVTDLRATFGVDDVAPYAIRACGTCRHERPSGFGTRCAATGFSVRVERDSVGPCGKQGAMWEKRPPRRRGVIERAWRFLFGGAGD